LRHGSKFYEGLGPFSPLCRHFRHGGTFSYYLPHVMHDERTFFPVGSSVTFRREPDCSSSPILLVEGGFSLGSLGRIFFAVLLRLDVGAS